MATDSTLPGLRQTHRERSRVAFVAYIDELSDAINPDLPAFETERWNRRLTEVVVDRGTDTATDFGRTVSALIGRSRRFVPEFMDEWIGTVAENTAANLNQSIEAAIMDAQLGENPAEAVDEEIERHRAVRTAIWATTITVTFANFGAHEGARASGQARKRWQVNSQNPRASHAAMNGETVDLGDVFSNGLRWPGFPGEASEVANCQCSLVFP